jgi:YVTN family beta-propeller protein
VTDSVGNTAYSQTATIAVNPLPGYDIYLASYGSSGNGVVSVINTGTLTITNTINVGKDPLYMVITPDGKYLYVSNTGGTTLSVINTATDTVINTISLSAAPGEIAITPDGRYAYISGYGGSTMWVINTLTRTISNTITGFSDGFAVATTLDGKYVYVANNGNSDVYVISTATQKIVNSIVVPSTPDPSGVGVTPDGRYAYAYSFDNPATMINIATNKVAYVYSNGCDLSPSFWWYNTQYTTDSKMYTIDCDGEVGGDNSNSIYIINTITESYKTLDVLPLPPAALTYAFAGIALNPSQTTLYLEGEREVSPNIGNTILVSVNTNSLQITNTISNLPLIDAYVFAPDGGHLYGISAGSGGDFLAALDLTTNTLVGTVPIPTTPSLWGLVISPVPNGG